MIQKFKPTLGTVLVELIAGKLGDKDKEDKQGGRPVCRGRVVSGNWQDREIIFPAGAPAHRADPEKNLYYLKTEHVLAFEESAQLLAGQVRAT